MARPIAKPEPDIPINCSAKILAAIKEVPIAHQGKDLLARKIVFKDSPFPLETHKPIQMINNE